MKCQNNPYTLGDNIPERKEDLYLVVKRSDIDACSERYGNGFLHSFCDFIEHIRVYRESIGKDFNNKYVVCNQDEPYAEDVWGVILRGEYVKSLDQDEKEFHLR